MDPTAILTNPSEPSSSVLKLSATSGANPKGGGAGKNSTRSVDGGWVRTTVTPSASDIASVLVPLGPARKSAALEATASVAATMREVTITLPGVAVTSMSEGSTPSSIAASPWA